MKQQMYSKLEWEFIFKRHVLVKFSMITLICSYTRWLNWMKLIKLNEVGCEYVFSYHFLHSFLCRCSFSLSYTFQCGSVLTAHTNNINNGGNDGKNVWNLSQELQNEREWENTTATQFFYQKIINSLLNWSWKRNGL